MKKILFIILILYCMPLFAADSTNCVVNITEDDYGILFYGPVVFPAGAGTDNTHTQYMRIEGIDFEKYMGHLQIWATDITGTEDYNGFIEFSNTITGADFLSLATDADLDALAITVKADTVGISEGKKCMGFKYMRLKLDGQTGNPNGLSVNWYIYLHKISACIGKRIAHVGDTL